MTLAVSELLARDEIGNKLLSPAPEQRQKRVEKGDSEDGPDLDGD